MGGSKSSSPQVADPYDTALAQMRAQVATVLPLQQAQMQAYQDPTSGLLAQNQLQNQLPDTHSSKTHQLLLVQL